MGDSGPTHEVGTFSNRADDLHIREILLVVYSRDCSTVWSASIHSVEQRPQIYSALLYSFSTKSCNKYVFFISLQKQNLVFKYLKTT